MSDRTMAPGEPNGAIGSAPNVAATALTASAEDRPVRDLEISIPAFNEARRLPATLDGCAGISRSVTAGCGDRRRGQW